MRTLIKSIVKVAVGALGSVLLFAWLPFVLAPVLESQLGSAPTDAWRASLVVAAAGTVLLWVVLFSDK